MTLTNALSLFSPLAALSAPPAPLDVLRDHAAAVTITPEELLIRHTAGAMGVDADFAVCIAWHESRYDVMAVGDDGMAIGLWQWHLGSWEYVRGKMGLPLEDRRNDPVESTITAIYAIDRLGLAHWWTASSLCEEHINDTHMEEWR